MHVYKKSSVECLGLGGCKKKCHAWGALACINIHILLYLAFHFILLMISGRREFPTFANWRFGSFLSHIEQKQAFE